MFDKNEEAHVEKIDPKKYIPQQGISVPEKVAKFAELKFPGDEDAQIKYLTRVFQNFAWHQSKIKNANRRMKKIDAEAKRKKDKKK